ncbi:MAG TPA: DUF4304 domain-containing protein [Vitreimonas sp.]|nr:DUF4304 domain-containing protein [Vitreimonas sp.]
MTSKEFYSEINKTIGNDLKTLGFKKSKSGMLSWYKPYKDKYFTFWFQVNRWGWSDNEGSSFCIEFQFADNFLPGHGKARERIIKLLDKDKLIEAHEIQTRVHTKIGFISSENDFSGKEYTWFKYFDEEDAQTWAKFFLRALPSLVNRFFIN